MGTSDAAPCLGLARPTLGFGPIALEDLIDGNKCKSITGCGLPQPTSLGFGATASGEHGGRRIDEGNPCAAGGLSVSSPAISSVVEDRRLPPSNVGANSRRSQHVEEQGNFLGAASTLRYGTSLADIYAHSWRRIPTHSWRWVPKCTVLGELGFSARTSEIRRLGARAHVVRQNLPPPPLYRSFATVVVEGDKDRGRGRFPRRFGDSSRGWIRGKRSAPEDWSTEDDLLGEEELRVKLWREHAQKSRFSGDSQGVSHHPGSFHSSFGSDNSRVDSRNFGVSDHVSSEQCKGRREDFRGRGNFNRSEGFNRGTQGRGDPRGGLLARDVPLRADTSRSNSKWEESGSTAKGEDQIKSWGEIGPNTGVLRGENMGTCFRCLQSRHHQA